MKNKISIKNHENNITFLRETLPFFIVWANHPTTPRSYSISIR